MTTTETEFQTVAVIPVLCGSPKQVAWAEVICTKRIPGLLALAGDDCERAYAADLILQATAADWWIDRRGDNTDSLALALVDAFGRYVNQPASNTANPDPAADVALATNRDVAIANARNSIQEKPGYHYSEPALVARIDAGLAPGDTWYRSSMYRAVYLGNKKVMVQRFGNFQVALETQIVDATDEQLDGMLIAIGQRAAIEAITKQAVEHEAIPSVCVKPNHQKITLRRILVLADSVDVGFAVPSGSDNVIEAIDGFEGGIITELGKPFFGRRGNAKGLLVQVAYVKPIGS